MIGRRIQKIRKERELSQKYLASKMGVSDKAVSSWETERTEPNIESLPRLAEVLNCKMSDLIGGDETPCSLMEQLVQENPPVKLLLEKIFAIPKQKRSCIVNKLVQIMDCNVQLVQNIENHLKEMDKNER